MAYQSVNPYDGKTVETFVEMTDGQLEAAIATAAAAYETWRHKSYAERAVIVAKAAVLMHANVDAFARRMTVEMGKRIDEARGEVEFSSEILAYYAKNAERFLAPVKLNPTIGEAHMESSPNRRDLRCRTVEFSVLPTRTRCRPSLDGRQRPFGQALEQRAEVRDRLRKALDRCGCARRTVYQSFDLTRSVRPCHR